MPRLHNSIAIDAAPDEVWSVLGDLAATPEWIPGVVSAEVNGERPSLPDGGRRRDQGADRRVLGGGAER